MKNLLVSLLLFFVAVSSYGQTKHLSIMGIPITGNIATFQQKLVAKSYRVDAAANKDLPVGQRAFKGKFSGHDCSLIAYYFQETKIVHKVRVSIDFPKYADADNAYNEFKKNLLMKYKNTDLKKGRNNGREFIRVAVFDDNDIPLGVIDLFVGEGEGDYESELVIGYKDISSIQADIQNQNDL
ncbi:MAG: hypothetical protein J6U46_05520 [Bacteroidaceae bacterium]|nr:hypothetical protein [Bacteroidaceae bacterium]